MMSRKQRYLTAILAVVILGTIAGMKAWTPDRRPAAPQDARGGETAKGTVENTMPLAKPARKGGS